MSVRGILRDKLIVIVGGGGVIGSAIAFKLHKEGRCHNLVLMDVNVDKLKAARATLMQQTPDEEGLSDEKLFILPCDITNEQSVSDAFMLLDRHPFIAKEGGGIDLLVNCAGIFTSGETEDISADTFTNDLKVNVLGPFLCSREALKRMKARGRGGRIINVGSISSKSPRPNSAPYTSKYAITGLTQSLALDARSFDIAVGIIHPGNVMSPILTDEEIEQRKDTEGFIQPDDVASCVLTMASLPYHANVLEMTVMPTKQPLIGRG